MLNDAQYVEFLIRTLKKGSVVTLAGDMPFVSDRRHHFVVLNYDPQSGEYLVAVNNTSHVVNNLMRLNRQQGTDVSATTVVFEPGQYSFFPEQTLFDCNSVHEITPASLARARSLGNLTIPSNGVALSEDDIEKLSRAALNSRNVSPINKKLIDPDYQP